MNVPDPLYLDGETYTGEEYHKKADEVELFLRNRATATGPLTEYDVFMLEDASTLIDHMNESLKWWEQFTGFLAAHGLIETTEVNYDI